MSLPKNILVPTDFSPGAEAALDYATDLAAKLDAKVHVLNAVPTQALGGELGLTLTTNMVQELFANNRKALAELIAARAGKCAFGPPIVEAGDARDAIGQTIARLAPDLVVMGTHGRRGFARLFLGSVAEAVSRTSPCPVLLVRGGVS